jgi:hypothetical protein
MNNFNNVGGGVVVTQWTTNNIKIWIFARNNIPPSIVDPNSEPNVCEFGRPDATFAGCNFAQDMTNQQLVITNTFCGDWGEFS